MSRSETLRVRLLRREISLLKLARARFLLQSEKSRSFPIDYQYWKGDHEFLAAEKEVLSVRQKLGESLPGEALGIVYSFLSRFDELGTKQTMGDWIHLSRLAVDQIDALLVARQQDNLPAD